MYSKGIPRASNEYIYSYVPPKTSISDFLCNHEHISVSILFIPVHRCKTPSFGSFTIEDIACTLELCQFRIVLLLSLQAVVAMRISLLVTYFGIFFCHHIALLMCVEIDLILIQPPWKLFVFALDTFDVIVSQLTLSIVRYVTFKGQTCMKWAYPDTSSSSYSPRMISSIFDVLSLQAFDRDGSQRAFHLHIHRHPRIVFGLSNMESLQYCWTFHDGLITINGYEHQIFRMYPSGWQHHGFLPQAALHRDYLLRKLLKTRQICARYRYLAQIWRVLRWIGVFV